MYMDKTVVQKYTLAWQLPLKISVRSVKIWHKLEVTKCRTWLLEELGPLQVALPALLIMTWKKDGIAF